MATPISLASMEGFDIYSAGAIPNNYPWFVTNAAIQGQINAVGGAFGGGALTFPSTGLPAAMASGFEYQFRSTLQPVRGVASAQGGSGLLTLNMWLNVSQMTAGSGPLITLGTAGATNVFYQLLGISNSTTAGTVLQFSSDFANPTNSPYTFGIQQNQYYWVQIVLAFSSASATPGSATINASYFVNGTAIQSNVPLAWTSDKFTAGQVANRLKFYGSNFISYLIDDLVVQATSGADAGWPVATGSSPTVTTLPLLPSQRIRVGTATGNGSVTQWTPSGTLPNWQSATDSTGANFVVANAAGQVDMYKWSIPAVGNVHAVSMRGSSPRYGNIVNAFKQDSTSAVTNMIEDSGPSEHLGIAETDATGAAWTNATLAAAEFGQVSK